MWGRSGAVVIARSGRSICPLQYVKGKTEIIPMGNGRRRTRRFAQNGLLGLRNLTILAKGSNSCSNRARGDRSLVFRSKTPSTFAVFCRGETKASSNSKAAEFRDLQRMKPDIFATSCHERVVPPGPLRGRARRRVIEVKHGRKPATIHTR